MLAIFQNVFDYAGLFPPTKLDMASAVKEYLQILDKAEGELVDRFLVPAVKAPELIAELRKHEIDEGFPVSVIASPYAPGSLTQDWELVQDKVLSVSGFELRLLPDQVDEKAYRDIARSKAYTRLGSDFFLEIPLDEHCSDNLANAAEILENCGFKARLGGLAAEDFPSSESVSQWIVDTTGFGAPVKFTAGLHQALRHHDRTLGVERHGFANVLCAYLGAELLDLASHELGQILEYKQASQFKFTDDELDFGFGGLDWDDVEEAMADFGGIGSCSIKEPLDSLKALHWLD